MCVYVCVYIYVCVCVCEYVCMYVCVSVCVFFKKTLYSNTFFGILKANKKKGKVPFLAPCC